MAKRILVVEDNPDNMALVNWILEDAGYDLCSVTTGEECLAFLNNSPVDLVLLDISLPGIDGKEVARVIRATPTIQDMPILACTAHAIKEEAAEILEAGVDNIVTKPIDEPVLLDALRRLLHE